jgi:hypothetical protein
MKGHFSTLFPQTLSSTKISVEDFSAKLKQGHIHGNLALENLAQPLVNLTLDGKLNLEDFDPSRTCQRSDKIFEPQATVCGQPLMKTGIIAIINSVHTNE